MSVIVFVSHTEGRIAKAGFEAVYYGSKVAGGPVTAVSYGDVSDEALAELGQYGANKVLVARGICGNDGGQITKAVASAAADAGATTIVCAFDPIGREVAPRLSARLGAGLVTGATQLPSDDGTINKNVFSGKAVATVTLNTDKKIIAVMPNSLAPEAGDGAAEVVEFNPEVGERSVVVKEKKGAGGALSLPEAELVVSAGRGLKGPENWGMVEELATELGAATACSRPVADIGWRPHHEHVGQTGIAIRPNLYIAIGISGAIQHLAGVNSSKTIVVINTDAEAPFFKAADYGIVGDAFDVVPKLVEAVKSFKAANA